MLDLKALHTENLDLSIQLSLDGFSFYIADKAKRELLFFKEVGFHKKKHSPQELLEALDRLLRQEGLLNRSYKSVQLIHVNNLFSVVPDEFFDESHLKSYLQYSIKLFDSDYITFDSFEGIEAKAVYLPFVNINNYFFAQFGEFEFFHGSQLLIDHLIKINQEKTIFLEVNLRGIELIITNHGKLEFYNHFDTRTEEDILYYILFSLEQLGIKADKSNLLVSGFVNSDTPLLHLLGEYFQEVQLRSNLTWTSLPKNIQEKYKFNKHLSYQR
jgi:hypothetical protein